VKAQAELNLSPTEPRTDHPTPDLLMADLSHVYGVAFGGAIGPQSIRSMPPFWMPLWALSRRPSLAKWLQLGSSPRVGAAVKSILANET